jgi:hypothetical protein
MLLQCDNLITPNDLHLLLSKTSCPDPKLTTKLHQVIDEIFKHQLDMMGNTVFVIIYNKREGGVGILKIDIDPENPELSFDDDIVICPILDYIRHFAH